MPRLRVYPDRTTKAYLLKVAYLLTDKSLISTAKLLEEGDRDDQQLLKLGYLSKATIYFSGLAGLTLFGSSERFNEKEICAKAFETLLNTGVKRLNVAKVALQIKLLFAYPFSNFMYDMLYLEINDQHYLSAECMKGPNKYEHNFEVDSRLTIDEVTSQSPTYDHLRNTLRKLQRAIDLKEKIWNVPKTDKCAGSPNNLIVKFCPINLLCCMLRINNVILSDPYIYSKKTPTENEMSLLTPITWLEIPTQSKETKKDKDNVYQFCSFLSHFKYLWEHPLTLYSTDATMYKPGNKDLHRILKPYEISYYAKAKRILRKMADNGQAIEANHAHADNWKQFMKNELLLNCSKVLANSEGLINNKKIKPLRIFIIGAWENNMPNKYMLAIEEWIDKNLSDENSYGLQLVPEILRLENGETFTPKLYKKLSSSHLGIVFQTRDIDTLNYQNFSRPNVYLEKGYLMGKLKKTVKKATKEECERIFVFKEKGVTMESDNAGIGYTEFVETSFKNKIHEFIFWLWNVTELNKKYALKLLENEKPYAENDEHTFNRNYRIIKEYSNSIIG